MTSTTSILCRQNLVIRSTTCFDHSQLIPADQTTTTLKLSLTATNLDLSKPPNPDQFSIRDHKDTCHTVTHPSSSWPPKPAFSRLTANSLDLCTEHLGSESGNHDLISISDLTSLFPSTSLFSSTHNSTTTTSTFQEPQKLMARTNPYRREPRSSPQKVTILPPPLTTMVGPNSLQMRRHREGGRLIIDAVETPCRNSFLQAERSNGRLRIRCFSPRPKTSSSSCTTAADKDEYDGEEGEEEEECCGGETAKDHIVGSCRIGIESKKEELAEGEMNNVEKFQQRLSRCKEGRHSWKPDASALWVATS